MLSHSFSPSHSHPHSHTLSLSLSLARTHTHSLSLTCTHSHTLRWNGGKPERWRLGFSTPLTEKNRGDKLKKRTRKGEWVREKEREGEWVSGREREAFWGCEKGRERGRERYSMRGEGGEPKVRRLVLVLSRSLVFWIPVDRRPPKKNQPQKKFKICFIFFQFSGTYLFIFCFICVSLSTYWREGGCIT